jgi:small subunit ribosomal protein S1
VPSSQLATKQVKNIPESFREGDSLPLRVIEFDKENKKIVCSVVEYLKGKDQEVVDAYLASHGLMNAPAAESLEIRPEELNFDEL